MNPQTPGPDQSPINESDDDVRRARRSAGDEGLFVLHVDRLTLAAERVEAIGDEYGAMIETICGAADDSQPVERYDGTLGVTAAFVAAHQGAACQVQWNANLATIYTNPGDVAGVRWGSGTMISPNLVLTCGHLFDQTGGGWNRPLQNGTTNIIPPHEIARNMRLNFNYQIDAAGNLRPEQSFAILELLEYRLGGIDMAVCRIEGTPGNTFGRTRVSAADAAVPDMLCIIGHPAGLPKRIEAGPTTSLIGNRIHYGDIDTLGGNSGSGILRAADGLLIGIHTNGGCNAASPAGGATNFGQRIGAVVGVSPTLQALLRPKLKFADEGGPKPILDKPAFDTPVTLKFRDDVAKPVLDKPIGDRPGTLKFRDDVKSPGLDKPPGLEGKAPGFDNKHGFDQPGRPPRFGQPLGNAAPPARPFILATPHHSSAWSLTVQPTETLGAIESTLLEMEQAMAAGEAELAQLDADYRQLWADYLAAGGTTQG